MPVKFNGNWSVKVMRALPTGTPWVGNLEISVASYGGTQFTFTMRIDGADVAFPATDVTDRFTIGPYTHGGKIYQADVWRVDLFYDADRVETLLNGVIKRSVPERGHCTDPDMVSFTAVKTG